MRLSNKTYDFLKWFALVALPAFQVFWLTVGKVWSFPYLTEIGATIGATGLFIAALLGLNKLWCSTFRFHIHFMMMRLYSLIASCIMS